MSYIESSLKLRRSIANMTGTSSDDWFLCLKARYGLELAYRAIRETLGTGSVLTTPYTCITSVNPIISAKLTPGYLDINPSALAPTALPANLAADTRAVTVQHTLGQIGDKSAFISDARSRQLIVVEDCAHCLLRFARDANDQPLADISVHSFGVEKILPGTKFGGALYLNPRLKEFHPDLYNRITQLFVELPAPSLGLSFRVRAYRHTNSFLQHLPRGLKPPLRKLAITARLLEPAIYPYEQEGRQATPSASNQFVNQRILSQLPTLAKNYEQRKKNVAHYQEKLHSEKFTKLFPETCNEPLLAFPIAFADNTLADSAYELLTQAGYFIRRWYKPLLYPGPRFNEIYHYSPATCPEAEALSPCVLCLPTDLPANQTEKIIALLCPPSK